MDWIITVFQLILCSTTDPTMLPLTKICNPLIDYSRDFTVLCFMSSFSSTSGLNLIVMVITFFNIFFSNHLWPWNHYNCLRKLQPWLNPTCRLFCPSMLMNVIEEKPSTVLTVNLRSWSWNGPFVLAARNHVPFFLSKSSCFLSNYFLCFISFLKIPSHHSYPYLQLWLFHWWKQRIKTSKSSFHHICLFSESVPQVCLHDLSRL